MSTNIICFCEEIRKICGYPILSGDLVRESADP